MNGPTEKRTKDMSMQFTKEYKRVMLLKKWSGSIITSKI